MADNSITFDVTLSDKQAQTELAKLQRKIADLKKALEEAQTQKPILEENLNKAEMSLERAVQRLKEMRQAEKGAFSSVQIQDQAKYVTELKREYEAALSAVQKNEKLLAEGPENLQQMETAAAGLVKQLNASNSAGAKFNENIEKTKGNVDSIFKRIKGLVKRVLLFSVIAKGLNAFRNWFSDVVKMSPEAADAIGRLKGALLNLAQPIVNVLIPAFTKFVNWLANIVNTVAAFVAGLSGKTAKQNQEAAKALYEEESAIKGVGSAAKKASKQLASFDELNILTKDNADGAGSALNEAIKPIFDATELQNGFASKLKTTVDDVFFDWDNLTGEKILKKIITGLSIVAGGLIGFSVVGFGGAVIGMLIGASIGVLVSALTFDDNGKIGKEEIAKLLVATLMGAVGGIIGFTVGGPAGALIGMTVGVDLSLVLQHVGFGKGNGSGVTGQAGGIVESIRKMGEETAAGFDQGFANTFKPKTFAESQFGQFLQRVKEIFGIHSQSTVFADIGKNVMLGFINGITGAFSGVKNAVNAILGFFERMVNGVIDAINRMVSGLNALHFNIPSWIPVIGGKSFGFNLAQLSHISIPRLATGAVVPPNREFMAMLGDNKQETEVVSPLSTMKQAMLEAFNEAGFGNQKVEVYIGGEKFTSFIAKQQRNLSRATGR